MADALAAMDASGKPLDEFSVHGELIGIADKLGTPTESERSGALAEGLAFMFCGQNERSSQWGTHYGPMMTGEDNNGQPFCSPDIRKVDATTLQHWSQRAIAVTHPVLKARYADLAWDFAPALGQKRDMDMVKIAIDAYLAQADTQYRDGLMARITAVTRAFDLASQVKDTARAHTARAALLALHDEAIANNQPVWWMVPKRLLRDNRTGMTSAQRTALIQSLEKLVLEFGDVSKPNRFDPHDLESAVDVLVKHYRKHGTDADIKRLEEAAARCWEAAAGLGDVMVAPSFLQSTFDAYKRAGMKEDAARVRIKMEEAIQTSNKTMKAISTSIEIKKDDIETFVAGIIDDNPGITLARLANTFLSNKETLEKQMHEVAKTAPLQAMIPKKLMQDDHVAAIIGSVKDDPTGRLIDQTSMHFSFESIWLMAALDAAIEKHELTADHLTGWSNRLNLFEDMSLLKEGFEAFFEEDYVKALHVLVPQAEAGLRAIAVSIGLPATKAHPVTTDASVSINMGDILSHQKVLDVIGEDMALHFRALFADPRGMNLRNRAAHGLIKSRSIHPHTVRLVVHALLVLGVWKDIVEARAKREANTTAVDAPAA